MAKTQSCYRARLAAAAKAGVITGSWSAMGSESGPLELKKAPKPKP